MLKKWISNIKSLLNKKSMLLAFLLLLILGFYFGYFLTDIMDKKNQINLNDIEKNNLTNVESKKDKNVITNVIDDNIITSETKMVFTIKYLKSQDENKEILSPQKEIIGFNEKETKDFFNQWEIIDFTSNEIILERQIDSYSPKHFKVGIGKRNGEDCIAIYKFDKEGQEVIDFATNTPISILNQREREKFIKGMIFSNEEDLHRMLENYDL